MTQLKKVQRFFILLLLFFLVHNSLESAIVIDFEELRNQTVRIVSFDTIKQRLLHYEVMAKKAQTRKLSEYINFYVPQVSPPELNYFLTYGGDEGITISLPFQNSSTFSSSETFIVRASKINENNFGSLAQRNQGKIHWYSQKVEEKNPQDINKLLGQSFKKKSGSPDFPIITKDPKKIFLSHLNDDEKGELGELVTDLTMLSFGYNPLPSKYEYNHGIDGVFESWSKNFLYLTESKAGDTSDGPKAIMNNQLKESHLYDRLMTMGECGLNFVVQTHHVIKNYLREKPYNIYKFAHKVAGDGMAQFWMLPLNIKKMPTEGLELFGASPQDKVSSVEKTLKAFGQTPEDQFKLSLQAIDTKILTLERAIQLVHEHFKKKEELIENTQTPISFKGKISETENKVSIKNNTNIQSPSIVRQLTPSFNESASIHTFVPNPPENFFLKYSYEKLVRLVTVLNKNNSQEAIGSFCGVSRTPIRKILGVKEGNIEDPEYMWNYFIKSLDKICEISKTSKEDLERKINFK